MKAISVVIPVYNVENYVEECLVSVLNQTLRDIEIICVDDGTKDHSMDIIEKYKKHDGRIVIIHKENGGLSSARNAGIRVAQGEYIYFLDSDDYLREDTLESLYRECTEHDLDTIFFNADSFFENDELAHKQSQYQEYYHRPGLYEEIRTGQELFRDMESRGDFRPSACLQMNRISLLKDNDIWFKEGIIHEDNLFSLWVSLYSRRAKHVAESFYQRRVREGSIMTYSAAERRAWGYYTCASEIIPHIAQMVTDETVMASYIRFVNGAMYRNAVNIIRRLPCEEYDRLEVRRETEQEIYFELFVKDNARWLREAETARIDAESRLNDSNHAIDDERRAMDDERRTMNDEIQWLRDRVHALETCNSYRVGRGVTLVPRKIKTAVRVCGETGVSGMWKAAVHRISPDFYHRHYAKVSIIMPVYNGEKYLRQCLDSLLCQTLGEIDVICVDDGSTDGSVSILEEYKNRDIRFRYFSQEHKGAGAARNLGMKYAHGDYLLFLDSDDYFDKDLCKKAYEKAVKYKAEVVLFGTQRIDMQSGNVEKMGWVLRSDELPREEIFKGTDISDRLFQVTSNCPWSKMFKRKYIQKKKLYFQDIKHANDAYFVRIGMALADKIIVLDENLVTYRYNDVGGENVQAVKYQAPLEFYKAFIAVKDKLTEENMFDIYRKSYVNWTLTESMFNYRTMKTDEAKQVIKDKLLTDGFDRLGISGCKEEDIYNRNLYNEYLEFIS